MSRTRTRKKISTKPNIMPGLTEIHEESINYGNDLPAASLLILQFINARCTQHALEIIENHTIHFPYKNTQGLSPYGNQVRLLIPHKHMGTTITDFLDDIRQHSWQFNPPTLTTTETIQTNLALRIPHSTYLEEKCEKNGQNYIRIAFKSFAEASKCFGFLRTYLKEKNLSETYELSPENTNIDNTEETQSALILKPSAKHETKDIISLLDAAFPGCRLIPQEKLPSKDTQAPTQAPATKPEDLLSKTENELLKFIEIESSLLTLISHANSEARRIRNISKYKKGSEDKAKLFEDLASETNKLHYYFISKLISPEEAEIACTKAIKECALIAHHKRYSKLDRTANLITFGLYHKKSTSWANWEKLQLGDSIFEEEHKNTLKNKSNRSVEINNLQASDYNTYRRQNK